MNIQWGIRCPKCQDVIYSNSRHDWERCLWGAVYSDGGWDYDRVGWDPDGPFPVRVSREVENRRAWPWYYSDEKDRERVLLRNTQEGLKRGEL